MSRCRFLSGCVIALFFVVSQQVAASEVACDNAGRELGTKADAVIRDAISKIKIIEDANLASANITPIDDFSLLSEACLSESEAMSVDEKGKLKAYSAKALGSLNSVMQFSEQYVAADDTGKRAKLLRNAMRVSRNKAKALAESVGAELPAVTWDNDFVSNFYAGYEATTVSGLNSKGTPRVGFSVYNQLVQVNRQNKGFDVGFHIFGSVLSSNTAEQSTSESGSDNGDGEVKSTLAIELGVFVPFWNKAQSVGQFQVGFVAFEEAHKADSEDDFARRRYKGLRFAHSQEAFFDVVAGSTQGVSSNRLELRGQLPIAKILEGDLIAGGRINVDHHDNDAPDSVQFYLMWKINFDDALN